ncbi:alpha/beta fold hydrolase [Halorientalis brevis]|uniref:Alpha/beta fold hydrolase n=1 Tax=Halorientalis brevis TaxID=1126241 RepID=A0ABD6CAU9_9EURY|nr:alpha/beta hydrolase [Halorientalis brevis]
MASLRSFLANRLGDGEAASTAITTGDDPPVLELAAEIMDDPQTADTRDGRTIGYADVGDPDGDPVFVFHGFPNSRVFGALFDEAGRAHGLRIVAPERPGLGVSDPQPDRTLTDWPADVADVADALGVDEFAVFGISGGGPYAAATAALLGERVERAAIACGLAPMDAVDVRERLWYYSARFLPSGNKLALWLLGRRAMDDREAFLESMAESAAPADEALWTGEVGKVVHASMIEARRNHGLDPLVTETRVFGSPWGFDLSTIDVPVGLWYGKADVLVPPEMGLYLTEKIPTAEAHIYPDLDHLSIVTEHEADIAAWLAA